VTDERDAVDRELLARIGLRDREPMRFRRQGSARWRSGTMHGVGAFGSLTTHDADVAAGNLRRSGSRCAAPAPAAG
jgi:hypothetical protein